MNKKLSHQYGDAQDFSSDNIMAFLNDKCDGYMKLKSRLKKLMPSRRICKLALPKYCSCPPRVMVKDNSRPHIQIINLDIRQRTRLEQLAYPTVRRLLECRDCHRKVYHPKRYSHINRLIRRSLFSQYSRLANVQAPEKPFRPTQWSKREWRKHGKALKKLATPRRIFLPSQTPTKMVPLEELLPRIKKLSKPKQLFCPLQSQPQKNSVDIKRIFDLAKPKEFDPALYIKPELLPIDRSKPFKPSKRTLELSEPKDRSAAESDMKDNQISPNFTRFYRFPISPNALKFKCKAGSRLANLAKPKEYEESPIKANPFTINKNALKAKASKRTIELAEPKSH